MDGFGREFQFSVQDRHRNRNRNPEDGLYHERRTYTFGKGLRRSFTWGCVYPIRWTILFSGQFARNVVVK